jgi:hypothetical protein
MITTAPTQTSSIASQLSSKELQEGSKIISSLPTVVVMTGRMYPIDKIVQAVFVNEYEHEAFTQYMRKLDRYSTPEKKTFVAELLSSLCKS